MILSPKDAEAFFKLWNSIDAYVCRRTGAMPGVAAPNEVRQKYSTEDLARIRRALWDDPAILEAFTSENPFGLSAEEIEEVRRFRHAVRGKFYVERCLKNYVVFISVGDAPRVFGVVGLHDRIDEVLQRVRPVGYAATINAVLLPFRGRIVWDGIVSVDPVTFGPGIRRRFQETYLRAKERGEIITSLNDGPRASPPRRPAPDWRAAVAEIAAASERLGRTDTSLQAAAFRLLKISARLAQQALEDPIENDLLATDLRSARRALNRLVDAFDRA
jgi:hypothetical protein